MTMKINMEINDFRINHSRIIEQYQLIEWHLEGIFGLLEQGDFEELTHRVENDTMGELIRKVRFLIKENKLNLIDKQDFSILDDIRDDRNFWCHSCFLEVNDNPDKYEEVSKRLISNLDKVIQMNDKLEEVFKELM